MKILSSLVSRLVSRVMAAIRGDDSELTGNNKEMQSKHSNNIISNDVLKVTARPPLRCRENSSTGDCSSDQPEDVKEAEFTRLRNHYYGEDDTHKSSKRSFAILACVFSVALLALLFVYFNFPHLDEEERSVVKLPKNIQDAKDLGKVLSKYKDNYYHQVLFGYFFTYIFLQSFAIPGSIFLSILSGYLFPFPLALFLVCFSSASGASFCYLLSSLVGRRLVWRYIPKRAIKWSESVQRHKDNLLFYIIFLRITPFLPNWFINITSPIINVPIIPFFFGTFFGVAPPSFFAIQTGKILHKLTSSSETFSWMSFVVLAACAGLSLLPVVFKRKLKSKFD